MKNGKFTSNKGLMSLLAILLPMGFNRVNNCSLYFQSYYDLIGSIYSPVNNIYGKEWFAQWARHGNFMFSTRIKVQPTL